MVLDGPSKEQMIAEIKAVYAKKELPPLEAGAVGFMMSKQAILGRDSNAAHLMLYTTFMERRELGCGPAQISRPPHSNVPRRARAH